MKETLLDLLNHYLQGVMNCSDAVNFFHILKMHKLCKQQYKRLKIIIDIYHKLSNVYMDKYMEVPKVSLSIQRANISATSVNNGLGLDVINSWIDWETENINLLKKYCAEFNEQKECNLFKKITNISEMFLKNAKHIKQVCFKNQIHIRSISELKQNNLQSRKVDTVQK